MSDSQAYVTPVHRGLVRGYRELISGQEFTTADPSKSALAALHRQAVDASLAILWAQDGAKPRQLSLQNRQSLYAASQE